MKLNLTFVLFVLFRLNIQAQSLHDTIPPLYSSGNNGLFKYLSSTMVYPLKPKSENISQVIYASFLINEKGVIDSIWVINDANKWLKKEVVRCIKHMSIWKPAKINNKYVITQVNLPVGFYLKTDPISKFNENVFIEKKSMSRYSTTLDELLIIESKNYIETNTATYFNSIGIEALNYGEYEDAIVYFDKAYEMEPETPDLLFNRALAKFKSGDTKGACNDWFKAGENGDKEANDLYRNQCSN